MEWYIGVLKKYAVFSGRARRKEFWMFVLFNLILTVIVSILSLIPVLGKIIYVLYVIYNLAIIIPGLAVGARRLHDTNKSGLLLLLMLVPFVGAIILIVFCAMEGDKGNNQYGPDPKGGETSREPAVSGGGSVISASSAVPAASGTIKEPAAAAGQKFPLFTGSGVCDVCNKPLSGITAYIVPNQVFYNSPKYRDYWCNSPLVAMMGGTRQQKEAALNQQAAMDKSPGSAVCEDCIHMFQAADEGGKEPIVSGSKWTPTNPQIASNMPLTSLQRIFLFTSGNGETVQSCPVATGTLADTAGAPISDFLGKVPFDIIARTDIATQIERTGQFPDSAWLAMNRIDSDATGKAQMGIYKTVIRPFANPNTKETGVCVLLYQK